MYFSSFSPREATTTTVLPLAIFRTALCSCRNPDRFTFRVCGCKLFRAFISSFPDVQLYPAICTTSIFALSQPPVKHTFLGDGPLMELPNRAGGSGRGAPPHRDGVSETQPLSEIHLQERGLG